MVMGKLQAAPGDDLARGAMKSMDGGERGNGDGGGNPDSNHPAAKISLLVDGELDAEHFEGVCASLRDTGSLKTWACYHVIGDALRGSVASSPGFGTRFAALLAAEPTVLAPPRRRPAPAAMAWAAAATVAAVSVVGWVAMTTLPASDGGIAAAIATAKQAAGVRAVDARPAIDNEYLLVHQEYSPTTAIQGARPYLRAVAATDPDARK
jgi:sigma-E factor negative regulatory protein RseA